MSKPESNIITDYINLTQEYQTKYGKKTVLLMQVGAFYEVYGLKIIDISQKPDLGIKPDLGQIHKSEIVEFSQVCNLNIAEKSTTYENQQVVMAGFRDYTLDKYLKILTDAGFTTVVYNQEKEGKTITRKLNAIYSQGTFISEETDQSSQITNNSMCIWIDRITQATQDSIIVGVSTVNIFTGKSTIFEYQTQYSINPTTFDELERYVSTYSPSEVIFISNFQEPTVKSILQFVGLQAQNQHIHIIDTNDVMNEKAQNCTKQKYIHHILGQMYGEEAITICAEFNTHVIAVQSFCYLLNFIQEHNPNLVRNIGLPDFDNKSDRLILANHTLKQLNIIDDKSNDGKSCGQLSSVLSFLNRCSTSMGKRLFQSQLLNPTFSEIWLNKEYQMIESMLLQDKSILGNFRKQLSKICDIDKVCRQLLVRKIKPQSVYRLYDSIHYIQQLNQCLYENTDIVEYIANQSVESINTLCLNSIGFIESQLTVNNRDNRKYIQSGISPTLDQAWEKYNTSIENYNAIHQHLNKLYNLAERSTERLSERYSQSTEYFKIHETEKSGQSIQITKKRAIAFKQILLNLGTDTIKVNESIQISIKDIKFVSVSAACDEIEIPILTSLSKTILHLDGELDQEMAKAFALILENLETKWLSSFEIVSNYIAKLDVLTCKTYLAKEYNYCKPEILVDQSDDLSLVRAKELRHCLIEHIQQNEIYVPNDVCIDQDNTGILLYGTNAVGKTSLIRALGIAVIMAQSGMYVPCTQFVYKPYRAIFSRILGNDNIFKGLSTFAVEMSELRVILKSADENSLILGDELCSGTETESALSIFMAGLMTLSNKRASFIFATHFHEIIKYDEMRELTKIYIAHMAVHFDRELDCLVYDRKLRDGPGNRMYGLEVCKSLYLPENFLEKAYQIRNKYHPETKGALDHPASSYNSKKIRGMCELCNDEISQETHHLAEQKDADQAGFIGTFHKNHKANLLALCEKCHSKQHAAQIDNEDNVVLGKKKTTKGYKIVKNKK